jgi:hypothetical protein
MSHSSLPDRPWREVAQDLQRKTDSNRIAELVDELLRAFAKAQEEPRHPTLGKDAA